MLINSLAVMKDKIQAWYYNTKVILFSGFRNLQNSRQTKITDFYLIQRALKVAKHDAYFKLVVAW
jgi:hypothetical protein